MDMDRETVQCMTYKDRDTYGAVRIDCYNKESAITSCDMLCKLTVRVPHLGEELHLRWLKWVLFRETQPGSEETTLAECGKKLRCRA